MRKLKSPVFSGKSVFRGFSENYKEIPVSEGVMHNFKKFRIFWDILELKRMENDRMHTSKNSRTGKLQIIIYGISSHVLPGEKTLKDNKIRNIKKDVSKHT